jgi:hypothetical protein
MLELSINAKTMRTENFSKLKNLLLFLAAILFLSNFLILDEVKLAEDSVGLNQEQIEDFMERAVRNYKGYEELNETERQELRTIYTEAQKRIIAEDNLKILDLENRTFTFGVTFMHGIGVIISGFGQWINVLEIQDNGDSLINHYPRAKREELDPDPSSWFERFMAKSGYGIGKHLGFSFSVFLLLITLVVRRADKFIESS